MTLIPWEYIKEQLYLPVFVPGELAEKLTCGGLETKVIEKNKNLYFEFDPLPNRLDLLSWWGITQEIAVILNCQVKPINFLNLEESREKLIEVEIKNDDCRAFYLGLIKDIKIKESSSLIKEYLKVNGINSINNVVDLASLVMIESGQPLHVFDYDALPSKKKIIVHKSSEGEIMNSLQGQKLLLGSQDIVISSGEKIIDLTGIVGAYETAVTWQTKNILIECASFNPQVIKNTTRRLNISTVAGQYFSRGSILISSLPKVLQRFFFLLNEQDNILNSGSIFTYKELEKVKLPTIVISQEFIEKRVGQKLTDLVIESLWKQLKFFYQKKDDVYYVDVPNYRSDIANAEDLLEELLRVYDYNKLFSYTVSELKSTSFGINKYDWKIKNLRTYLANCGWQEVITYSLISEDMKGDISENKNSFYQLLKPKNDYHQYYRQDLISSHLKTLKYNLSHGNKNLRFFEISSIYGIELSEQLLVLSGLEKIFKQPFHNLNQALDFYWIKGALENIFACWQLEEVITFSPTSLNYLSSSQSAEIFLGEKKIGFLGQVKQKLTQKYQINESVFIAQISLTKIFGYLSKLSPKISYKPVSNFPISEKDLSAIFSEDIDYNQIIKEIKKWVGSDLQEVIIFDVYQSVEMEKVSKKSVSFRLTFQSSVKTLEKKEIEEMVKVISENLQKKFGAELRD